MQRVERAHVSVRGEVVASIARGLCLFVGVAAADDEPDAALLCRKVLGLRIFDDESGRMNRSVVDVGGSLLVVSQFTLHADCRRGRRPSFAAAAPPERARALFEHFVTLATAGPVPVATGTFQATMAVSLVNDGPVTILLDSTDLRS